MRVATFNVHSLRAGPAAVADVLSSARPDIVMLQECGPSWRVRRLARRLGMEAASPGPFDPVRNAVLFRGPWRRVGDVVVRRLSRVAPAQRRGFIAVPLLAGDLRLTAISAHLGLDPRERERHAAQLAEFVSGVDGPVVVGIDMNEGPGGPAARLIAGRLTDCFASVGHGEGATFPSSRPTTRIDFVFASSGLRPLSAEVWDVAAARRASDHLPVVVDLEPG